MRYLIISLLLLLPLKAFDPSAAAKIYEKVFQGFIEKPTISVYVENHEFDDMFKYSQVLERVYSPDIADVSIVTKKSEMPRGRDIVMFTTDLQLLKTYSNIVGAFYWDHGRPKIIFLDSRLKRLNIEVSPYFTKYVRKEI